MQNRKLFPKVTKQTKLDPPPASPQQKFCNSSVFQAIGLFLVPKCKGTSIEEGVKLVQWVLRVLHIQHHFQNLYKGKLQLPINILDCLKTHLLCKSTIYIM